MANIGRTAKQQNKTGASKANKVYPSSSALHIMSGDASNVTSPDGCIVQSKGDNAAIAVGTNNPMIWM